MRKEKKIINYSQNEIIFSQNNFEKNEKKHINSNYWSDLREKFCGKFNLCLKKTCKMQILTNMFPYFDEFLQVNIKIDFFDYP